MAYVIRAIDRPGALDIRTANRQAHIAFLQTAGDRLLLAGPLLSEAGEMAGSLLVVDMESPADVASWLADDPYSAAGLFEAVEITAFKPVIASFKSD